MLTAAQCIQMMRHAVGGSLPSGFDALGLINRAGHFLTTAHNWRWLSRTASVSLVADQAYGALPASFQKLLAAPSFTSGFYYNGGTTICMVDFDRILHARESDSDYSGSQTNFMAAVVSTETAGEITQRLELFPTPTANATISIAYRAGWTVLTTDSQRVSVPDYLELLFVELCRTMARGITMDDAGTIDVRLQGIMDGPMGKAARKRDFETQLSFGTLPGALPSTHGVDFFSGNVANPS